MQWEVFGVTQGTLKGTGGNLGLHGESLKVLGDIWGDAECPKRYLGQFRGTQGGLNGVGMSLE